MKEKNNQKQENSFPTKSKKIETKKKNSKNKCAF
jgi:hypothetical protein